jgi:ATP-dependent Clp protease ATP-binding subunit ClpB
MTSNIGDWSDGQGPSDPAEVNRILRGHFRPEFLNRIDAAIVFHGLELDALVDIVGIQIERLNKLLAERGLAIDLTPAAVRFLAERGYDPAYGARPVKRTIQQLVQDPLALHVLEGRFREGDRIRVDVRNGRLNFERADA